MNKKAISPLIATILLVVFALVLGVITMSWGKLQVEKAEEPPQEMSAASLENSLIEVLGNSLIIDLKTIDTPLKDLQIKHIAGQITEEEYLAKEKELLSGYEATPFPEPGESYKTTASKT